MLTQPSDPEKAPDKAPPAIVSATAPDTGQILWTAPTPGPYKIPIPQPLRVANDRLFITGGYGLGCLMFEVICVEGQWKTKLLFHNRNVAAHIHSPVFVQDRIYVSSQREQGGLATGLVCLSSTAERIWQTGPDLQFENGPLLIADGLAFVLHGKTGKLHLIELAPAGPRLLAQAKVLEAEHGNAWAPMALSRGCLLVRDLRQMKCLDVKGVSN
jgi:outer membrane protein assembly factor BamB